MVSHKETANVVLLPLLAFPLVSGSVALWLSWCGMLSSTVTPWASRNLGDHSMIPIPSSTAMISASVELLALTFCKWQCRSATEDVLTCGLDERRKRGHGELGGGGYADAGIWFNMTSK